MKLFSFLKTEVIEFLCLEEDVGVIPGPVPASKMIPDWYKKIPTHQESRDHFGGKALTAKKCLPMIDAMTLGFIIPLYGDVNITTNKDCSVIGVGTAPGNESAFNPYGGHIVDFHSLDQVGNKTSPSYPGKPLKFINRWVIKTAPGWSVLITPVLNSFEKRFTILSAVVDTDKYIKEINFPAVWNIPNFDEVLPAGTPLVTVIPFKRADMPTKAVTRSMTEKELVERERIRKSQMSRNHYYTQELREPREKK